MSGGLTPELAKDIKRVMKGQEPKTTQGKISGNLNNVKRSMIAYEKKLNEPSKTSKIVSKAIKAMPPYRVDDTNIKNIAKKVAPKVLKRAGPIGLAATLFSLIKGKPAY